MDSLNNTTLMLVVAIAVILVAAVAWLAEAIGRFEPGEQRTLDDAIALVRRLGEGQYPS